MASMLLAAGAAAPALAQGAPAAPAARPPVRVPGVSAAGNAVLTRMQTQVDPTAVALVREDAAVRQQMQAVIAAPTLDLVKLAAAMQHGQAVAARARALNDSHLLETVRALPPADRTPFLRAIAQQPPPRAPAR